MFNQQQKPAFKFVIRSKLQEETHKEETNLETTQKQESLNTSVTEDRKRKRVDNTTAPIATKKVHYRLCMHVLLTGSMCRFIVNYNVGTRKKKN